MSVGPHRDPGALRTLLAPFGALRPQPASDWTGEVALHPDLARLYAEVGPWGDDVPPPARATGLTIPTTGNPFDIPPLFRLWDLQAGYRWHGRTGARLPEWPDEWLVVADQGGDPFILDLGTGRVLHAFHGGPWEPVPLFPDLFAMAAALGTIGAVHEEAGEELYDADFVVRPAWRAAVRARLAPILGAEGAETVAGRFDW